MICKNTHSDNIMTSPIEMPFDVLLWNIANRWLCHGPGLKLCTIGLNITSPLFFETILNP